MGEKKEEAMGAEDQSEMRGTAEQAPGASLHVQFYAVLRRITPISVRVRAGRTV